MLIHRKYHVENGQHPSPYFSPDDKKSGGVYLTKTDEVKKVDDFERKLIFEDGTVVPVSEIIDIQRKITRGKQNGE